MTRSLGLKTEKAGMEKMKPPYLVLSTHQGFSDYYIAPLALFPHRANYVSDMEGFAAFERDWLYRKAKICIRYSCGEKYLYCSA